MSPAALTWTCHICLTRRPDALIAVRVTDRSAEWHLPPGTFQEHVRYCVDRPACVERAKTMSFLTPVL